MVESYRMGSGFAPLRGGDGQDVGGMGGLCPPLLPQFCGGGEELALADPFLSAKRGYFGSIGYCSNQRGGKRAAHVFQRPLSFVGVIPGVPYILRGGG